MKKYLEAAILTLSLIALIGVFVYLAAHKPAQITTVLPTAKYIVAKDISPVEGDLTNENDPTITIDAQETITLHKGNMVVLRDVVTDDSVTSLMVQLQIISNNLQKNDVIILVLDTPGGSVDAGNRLITYLKALPQRVKTVTLFAASMGFHIAESMDERLIIDSGTLMSHRAKLGGIGGEVPGELITRLNYVINILNKMDAVAAARMQMSYLAYREMIRDEYWVYGQDAVTAKAMDRVVKLRCGADLNGSKMFEIATMFGVYKVSLSDCPLIPGPLSVIAPENATLEATDYVKRMFTQKTSFTKDFISTGAWNTYQK